MRVRLLDMGEVSAARSQSIYHAVAATMVPEDNPVAILLRPASRLISIGADRNPAHEIDLELCLQERIPVLRRHLGGRAEMVGGNHLLFDFLAPEESVPDLRPITLEPLAQACRTLGLSTTLGASGEVLLDDAGDRPRQVGRGRIETIDSTLCLVASLTRDPEPAEHASILTSQPNAAVGDYPPSSLAQELQDRPDFAAIAEALVEAAEDSFGVELVPSMPTPDEMDAIYEWDERLVFDLEVAAGAALPLTDQSAC